MTIARLGCLAALLLSLTLVATSAGAEELEPTDVRHLELGDGYEIVVRREGVEAKYSGKLVRVTDDWLVLRSVSEGRSEFGVPMASKLPYAGRLFRNVGIGRATFDRWIPRASSTVVGRSIAEVKGNFMSVAADEPNWDEVDRVEFAEAGETSHHSGPMTLAGNTLHYSVAVGHEVETPMPVIGRLPGVGGLFTTREMVYREEAREVPLGSVLSVVEPVPEERVERVGRLRGGSTAGS